MFFEIVSSGGINIFIWETCMVDVSEGVIDTYVYNISKIGGLVYQFIRFQI
jgi:hypothetical protein